MQSLVKRFLFEDSGQDLIEYALLGSFVAIVALAGATALGNSLNDWYDAVSGWVDSTVATIP